MPDFPQRAAAIGSVADDVRRGLYDYVASRSEPVGRDEAAAALTLSRHQAKFHLDRLEEAGLLVSDYVRVNGRSGPGAGRPAKVYRRAPEEIAVSLPQRDYVLAGDLLARAIAATTTTGVPIADALADVARRHGRQIAQEASGNDRALARAGRALARHGYEPRVGEGCLTLANCPFHALMTEHTQLVCGLNHDLLTGFCDEVGGLRAELEPADDRCCVVVREE